VFDKPVDTALLYGATVFKKNIKKSHSMPAEIKVAAPKKKGKKYINSNTTWAEYQALRKTDKFWVWWKRQYARQHALCYYCSISLKVVRVNVEHIVPMSRGGTNNKKNMVLSCSKCNKDKGSKMLKKTLRKKLRTNLMKQVRVDSMEYSFNRKYQAMLDTELGEFYRNNF